MAEELDTETLAQRTFDLAREGRTAELVDPAHGGPSAPATARFFDRPDMAALPTS